MCAGCGSLPSTRVVVGGARAPSSSAARRPSTSSPQSSAPISQSASSARLAELALLDHDADDVGDVLVQRAGLARSTRAPPRPRSRRAPSSWPITSSDCVKRVKISPSPSPNTIRRPSQNALGYSSPKCTVASQRHVLVVDRVAAEDVLPEVPGLAEAVERLVDRRVAGRRRRPRRGRACRRSPPTRAGRPRSRGCARRDAAAASVS